jgi:hypothetical protein
MRKMTQSSACVQVAQALNLEGPGLEEGMSRRNLQSVLVLPVSHGLIAASDGGSVTVFC